MTTEPKSAELVERLRKLKWMVNCEMRGLIPDTTAYEAADTLEAQATELTTLRGRLADLEGALGTAREALANYACHGGAGIPCLRTADQCRTDCGRDAGDAIVVIDTALARSTEA